MAHIYCHWRNFFICLCTPCLLLLLLFIYVTVMMTMAMNRQLTEPEPYSVMVVETAADPDVPIVVSTKIVTNKPEKSEASVDPLFVAPGAVRTKKYGSTPRIFWEKKENLGFWNQLQKAVDLQFNPILGPISQTDTERLYSESWLSQSFSKVKGTDLVKLPEHLRNYVSSMNRRPYPVLIEPSGQCGTGATEQRALLLLAIRTSVQNYENRQAIRQSWGGTGWVQAQRSNSSGAYVRRVFVLGSERSPELQTHFSELLTLESQHYGDILQWDTWDTLPNGTVRELLFWSWFKDTCGQTYFVLEVDDLTFVNTGALVDFLLDELHKPRANSSLQDFMVGNVVHGGRPDTSSASEYFIPESFYKGLYPSYTSGAGRLYSGLLLKRLQQVSKRVHLFPIEEVYVGMCLIRLNLSPSHHPAFITSDFTKEEEEKPCAYHRVILVHKRSPKHMLYIWTQMSTQQQQLLCRKVTEVTPEKTPEKTPEPLKGIREELDKMHF